MTFDKFEVFQEALIKECFEMKMTKGKEYAHDTDRFANFNRLARALKLPNTTVGWVYCKKHLDAIESFIADGKTYSNESIRGRFVDALVYLTLIAGMIEENEQTKMGI